MAPIQVARIAFWYCIMFTTANYLFNLSLSLTTVTSTTVLSATSSFWTLLFGVYFLRGRENRFTVAKLIAVIVRFVWAPLSVLRRVR